MEQTPTAEELLGKIEELQAGHARLREEMTRMRAFDARHMAYSASLSQHMFPVAQRRAAGAGTGQEGTVSSEKSSGSCCHSLPLQQERSRDDSVNGEGTVGGKRDGGDDAGGSCVSGPSVLNFANGRHMNIMQSMGQSVHIFDLSGRIIYWNRTAEDLYGYSAEEAIGQNGTELLIDAQDSALAAEVAHHVTTGESWKGHFTVKNKKGEKFLAMATQTPFYDGDSTLAGIICMSSDSRSFQETWDRGLNTKPSKVDSGAAFLRNSARAVLGLHPQQPLQVAIASKMSSLASKVGHKLLSKMKAEVYNTDVASESEGGHHSDTLSDAAIPDPKAGTTSSGATTPIGDIPPCSFGASTHLASEEKIPGKVPGDYGGDSEGKSLHKIITDKAETWIGKTGLTWPWKGNERKSPELCSNRIPWSQLHDDQETDVVLKNLYAGAKPKSLVGDSDMLGENEAPGSRSSSCNVSRTSSASSCGSSSTSALNKVEMETDCLDHEILWEDLAIGEQIGQGSCGTVYHGLWYGSNVAIKAFSGQEYTDDVIHSFKQEVSLMKRLRHPNLLLFMGAVTSPERLCIVTEFLPRGSLFQLLRNAPRLDWRRRVHIALDVARGLNYLHHFNPPIVHGDLKSSNLLVDKNWTVKVGDFGLSRFKRETYLSVEDGKGTPQWMAPEILRNEPSDEKSDVYSFGVVLWEICTEKIPWNNLNSMQVIGAVGFMNQRLEIPEVLDPEWASIIESCWHSEPRRRPAFEKLLERVKDLQRRSRLNDGNK